jgi:hypothetical protein
LGIIAQFKALEALDLNADVTDFLKLRSCAFMSSLKELRVPTGYYMAEDTKVRSTIALLVLEGAFPSLKNLTVINLIGFSDIEDLARGLWRSGSSIECKSNITLEEYLRLIKAHPKTAFKVDSEKIVERQYLDDYVEALNYLTSSS